MILGVFYCAAGATLAVAVGIGVARLQAHSLHLGLPLLLHSTLNAEPLHIGIGRYFRLYGVAFEHLSEREGQHKECQDHNTYDDYGKN